MIIVISVLAILFLFITDLASATAKPQISGGGYHSLAIKSDSTVWTWG